LSKAAVLFYTSFNTVLLGLLFSSTVVGYYSVAEKVYMAVRSIFNPLIQSIFPFLANLRKSDFFSFKKYVRLSFFILLFTLSLFSLLLFNFGAQLLDFLLDKVPSESILVLKIFSVTLFFAIGGFLSSILIIEEKGKLLSKVTLITVAINLVFVYPLTVYYGAAGLAICFLLVQFVHFIIQMYVNRGLLNGRYGVS
jgi:PST family polysaccharide transporter